MKLTSVEICAGAGGQALGLEKAGYEHIALVELDPHACTTLRTNRPHWNVIEADLHHFDATPYSGIDLLAGGVPCPPFSKAGKQLGYLDDRDLFPIALRLVEEAQPRAVMLENVRGLLDPKFKDYRAQITERLETMGYVVHWKLLHAAHFGVPQLRPRTLMVALRKKDADHFSWPEGSPERMTSVGDALYDEMASRGWRGAKDWKKQANKIGPTLVGGSKKHGGADLGPTRARLAWSLLGVDGRGVADEAPAVDFIGSPRLTVKMAAIVQGFPKEWEIIGKKTNAYRQVGNAFPPPVAEAVGGAIREAILEAQAAEAKVPTAAPASFSQVPAV